MTALLAVELNRLKPTGFNANRASLLDADVGISDVPP